MKVLIITTTFPPQHTGSGKLLLDVCKQLSRDHNVEFDVLNITSRTEERDYSIDGINVFFKYVGRTNLVLGFIKKFLYVRSFLSEKQKKYDVVHCLTVSWATLFGVVMAKRRKLPTIMESTLIGDVIPDKGKIPHLFYQLKELAKGKIYNKVDIYKVYSLALKEEISSAKIKKPVTIISAPVDTDLYKPTDYKTKERIRRELGFDVDDKLILFVGALSRRKGVKLLVDSFFRVAPTHSKLKLVLLGPVDENDREYLNEIEKNIDELNYSDRVFIPKKIVENVSEYMKCCDLFVLPSIREGFGAVTIEAMSSGMPTVVTHIPGISESQIDHGRNGFIVYEKTPEGLADILNRILEMNSEQLDEVKINARKKAVESYSLNSIAEQTMSLYDGVLPICSK